MKKIVLTGPESSGKTTMATELATHYDTMWVPEYARTYLSSLERPYTEEDLRVIAKGQIELEQRLARESGKLLICDTGLVVIKVWSEYKFGRCHQEITQLLQRHRHDLYLLMSPDIAWQADPLRENPHDRDIIFELYLKTLQEFNLTYKVIKGNGPLRTQQAITFIDQILE